MNDATYDGVRELIKSMPDDSSVIFTTFSDAPCLGGRMRPRDVDVNAFRRLGGQTALYDTIVAVGEHTERHPSEKLTVVVLTDGQDTRSRASKADARRAIEKVQGKA